MWCLTEEQSVAWAEKFGQAGARNHDFKVTEKHEIIVALAAIPWSQFHWFGTFAAGSLCDFNECLMWVTQTDVWPGIENWQLFYRLRETYGERRRVYEAPGHLFLKHEEADLATFVELSILNGWDFEILTNYQYFRVSGSHDGFVHLISDDDRLAEEARQALDEAKIQYRVRTQ
jgi:hypothetical protein